MPKRWSSSRSRPARGGGLARCLLPFLLLVATSAAEAATVLERSVEIEIDGSGKVREHESLRVRFDDEADLEDWAFYPIYLDENRELVAVEAWVVSPEGRREKAGRKRQDRMDFSGDSTHTSVEFHLVDLSGLEVGSVLEADYEVAVSPYYPADQLLLLSDDDVVELEINIRGADLRYSLDGPDAGLVVEEIERGLRVHGRNLTGLEEPPSLAAAGSASYPTLRYAWDGGGTWQSVGQWYTELVSDLPRGSAAVEQLAAELVRGKEKKRDRLEAVLAYMRQKVRYVAVEVGIGGFRPSAPEEVAERKWGDCKDKALLLVELLRASGVEAYPALITLGEDRRIDRLFPTPFQFNHEIVAVPASAVALEPGDPVANGYLFLDPTQTDGGASYLHPAVQDQYALVVGREGGVLVRTPIVPGHESTVLVFGLEVSPEGKATGRAGLRFTGWRAAGLMAELRTSPPERAHEIGMSIFNRLVPGAHFSGIGWEIEEGAVPAVRYSLAVEIEGMIEFGGRRPGMRLPSLTVTPETRLLAELEARATAQRAQVAVTAWRFSLPEEVGCAPITGTTRVENGVGSFVQEISLAEDGAYVVERRIEIKKAWFDGERLQELAELATAEQRAEHRAVRFSCDA